jgi:hypothetical protein
MGEGSARQIASEGPTVASFLGYQLEHVQVLIQCHRKATAGFVVVATIPTIDVKSHLRFVPCQLTVPIPALVDSHFFGVPSPWAMGHLDHVNSLTVAEYIADCTLECVRLQLSEIVIVQPNVIIAIDDGDGDIPESCGR